MAPEHRFTHIKAQLEAVGWPKEGQPPSGSGPKAGPLGPKIKVRDRNPVFWLELGHISLHIGNKCARFLCVLDISPNICANQGEMSRGLVLLCKNPCSLGKYLHTKRYFSLSKRIFTRKQGNISKSLVVFPKYWQDCPMFRDISLFLGKSLQIFPRYLWKNCRWLWSTSTNLGKKMGKFLHN